MYDEIMLITICTKVDDKTANTYPRTPQSGIRNQETLMRVDAQKK